VRLAHRRPLSISESNVTSARFGPSRSISFVRE
jgi:hypothetical protein